MDAIRMLTEQHDHVDALFEKLSESSGEAKRRLFFEIADMLAMHAAIEEQHFYPAARASDTEDLLLESFEEHLEVKRSLSDLLRADVDEESFDERVEELKEQVQRHVAEEEGELFPRVQRLLGADELDHLGEEMLATMVEMADSEPRNDIPLQLDDEPAPLH